MSRWPSRSIRAAVVSGGLSLVTSSLALAQDPVGVPPPPPPATEPVPAPMAPEPPTTAVEAPRAFPSVAETSPAMPGPAAPMGADAPTAAAEEVEEDKGHWYDDFSIGAFVDAYGALRSDTPVKRPEAPASIAALPGQYAHEAYVTGEGFALAFAGIDAAYSGEKFGATVSLRFGPGVNRFYFADNGPLGIDNITQAYATYKPHEKVTIDLGQFYTLYGAEVTESWRNLNYTRGGLYYAMQPFWHTGLRANFKLHDTFALNAMLVNGVNAAFESNKSPSLGLQAVLTPVPAFALSLGYFANLSPKDGAELPFDNFIDVVATVTAGGFKLIGNFDLNIYKNQEGNTDNWWGVSIAPGYAFTDWFGAALRYEYLKDSANFLFAMPGADEASLNTFTATLDFKPVPGSTALVIRPEFRYEVASEDYFVNKDGEGTDGFWEAVLGVVVTSMP